MIRQGINFCAPINKDDNHIKEFRNFNRSNEPLLEDNEIRFDELNKSDYLYQAIILLIMRKIDIDENADRETLYKLIDDINNLLDNIFLLEVDESNFNDISPQLILKESYKIADRCLQENLFDYE